jgi:uncharacterized integral membrane protein
MLSWRAAIWVVMVAGIIVLDLIVVIIVNVAVTLSMQHSQPVKPITVNRDKYWL